MDKKDIEPSKESEHRVQRDFSKLLIVLSVAFISLLGPDEIRQAQGLLRKACLFQFVSLGVGLIFQIKIAVSTVNREVISPLTWPEFMLVNAQIVIFLLSYIYLGSYLFY